MGEKLREKEEHNMDMENTVIGMTKEPNINILESAGIQIGSQVVAT